MEDAMEEKVLKILSVLLGRPIALGENVIAQNEPKWDSLKHMEIIMTIEDEFGISFDVEDIPNLKSSEAIINRIKELKK